MSQGRKEQQCLGALFETSGPMRKEDARLGEAITIHLASTSTRASQTTTACLHETEHTMVGKHRRGVALCHN